MVKPGTYKHYKGKLYKVVLIAKHSETLEDYVVYQQLYAHYNFWVRPKSMFEEAVEKDGKQVLRFQFIEE